VEEACKNLKKYQKKDRQKHKYIFKRRHATPWDLLNKEEWEFQGLPTWLQEIATYSGLTLDKEKTISNESFCIFF
jgi:hypothetical protein